MKKFITLISALALAVVLGTGCATTNNGTKPPPLTPEKLEKASVLLKGTVRSALILVIDKNGTNAVPYIALSRDALTLFIGSDNYSPDALLKSLSALPSKALQKAEVKLAISTVVSAYELYYGDYVRGQVNGDEVALKLLKAIRDGCDESLRLSP